MLNSTCRYMDHAALLVKYFKNFTPQGVLVFHKNLKPTSLVSFLFASIVNCFSSLFSPVRPAGLIVIQSVLK